MWISNWHIDGYDVINVIFAGKKKNRNTIEKYVTPPKIVTHDRKDTIPIMRDEKNVTHDRNGIFPVILFFSRQKLLKEVTKSSFELLVPLDLLYVLDTSMPFFGITRV